LTKEEEQWEPSNKIVDNNESSNTNDESEEHDSDKVIYTTSKGKDEDKDYGEKYFYLGKKVDTKGVEESLPLGVRIRMRRSAQEKPLQKKDDSCVVALLRLKTSAQK
jgi:hypothetical protein